MYWATNHLLARLYFDSNIQETTKMQVYPDFSSFLPLHEKGLGRVVQRYLVNFQCRDKGKLRLQ